MRRSSLYPIIFAAFSFSSLGVLAFGQQPVSTNIVGIPEGTYFSDTGIPSRGRVNEVHIFSDPEYVCGVEIQFRLPDGRSMMSPRRGRSCGRRNSFRLAPDEHMVGLSGRYDTHITSMQIHTNKRTSPLYGGAGGTQDYRIHVGVGNQAVGFAGRSGRYLNAIGLNFVPLTIQPAGQTTIVGGNGGTVFSDSDVPRGAQISGIRVRSAETVYSIQAVYTLGDGRTLEGPVHGGEGGTLSFFQLDPGEYVIGLSGRSGIHINSISIRTNKRTSQIFGENSGGNIFAINVPAGKQAIGLIGRSDRYLEAIGLQYVNLNTSYRRGERSPAQRR